MKEIKYTTSAGGVVVGPEGKILLVSQGDSWSLPKGHVEEGEDILTTAKREIEEESGITQLELIRNLGNYERSKIGDNSEVKNIYLFLFKTLEINLHPKDSNNPEARWVSKDEVSDLLTHPKDKDFFETVKEKYLND